MGQLIEGKWRTDNILSNHDAKGLYFKRDSVFRHRIERDASGLSRSSP
jgi:glutathionyl-hydroquinone reductase